LRIVGRATEEEVSMQRTRFVLAAALAAVALVGAGCGGDDDEAADTTETTETDTTPTGNALAGSVGPGFDISGPEGPLMPGSYEVTVEDLSSAHNFHLTGPGVDVSTSVGEEGTETFSVELQAGTYEFVCDPHDTQMNGSFEVGP
jgi:Copper binding proteins, plastocyanin/azurin family